MCKKENNGIYDQIEKSNYYKTFNLDDIKELIKDLYGEQNNKHTD